MNSPTAGIALLCDDQGYWQQIEVYIRDHSEAEFSHSLCPECLHKLYPDWADAGDKPG
jgi:hypothetical protein